MKRCPQCYQSYADAEKFCELDGQPLVKDIAVTPSAGNVVGNGVVADASAQKRESSLMIVVGVMVGMVLTSLGYATYALWTTDPAANETTAPVSRADTLDSQQPTRPRREAVIEPTQSPEAEASPSPEAEAEAEATPAAQVDTVAAHLNQGPVSTGEREKKQDDRADKTIIEMNDGTTVEVDAAWQDKQGVWYRRGGLVSFVESKRIKAIQARREPKTDPVNSSTP